MRFTLLLALALAVAACEPAPENGWRPLPDDAANAVLVVPADGQPHRAEVQGGVILQPVPAADGSGFDLAGVPLYPGSRYSDVSLRRAPSRHPDGMRLFIKLPFTAPDPVSQVLDYYAAAFSAKNMPSQRDGDILNVALPDAHLTIAMESAGALLPDTDVPTIAPPQIASPAVLSRGELRLRRK
jgi:hypothetical protein